MQRSPTRSDLRSSVRTPTRRDEARKHVCDPRVTPRVSDVAHVRLAVCVSRADECAPRDSLSFCADSARDRRSQGRMPGKALRQGVIAKDRDRDQSRYVLSSPFEDRTRLAARRDRSSHRRPLCQRIGEAIARTVSAARAPGEPSGPRRAGRRAETGVHGRTPTGRTIPVVLPGAASRNLFRARLVRPASQSAARIRGRWMRQIEVRDASPGSAQDRGPRRCCSTGAGLGTDAQPCGAVFCESRAHTSLTRRGDCSRTRIARFQVVPQAVRSPSPPRVRRDSFGDASGLSAVPRANRNSRYRQDVATRIALPIHAPQRHRLIPDSRRRNGNLDGLVGFCSVSFGCRRAPFRADAVIIGCGLDFGSTFS